MTTVLLIAPTAAASLVFFYLNQVDQRSQSLGEHTVESLLRFDACVRATVRAEASLAEALLTHDPLRDPNALSTVEEQLSLADRTWGAFAAESQGIAEFEYAQRWWALREQATNRGLRPAIAAARAGDVDGARRLALDEALTRRNPSTDAADLFLAQEHTAAKAVLADLQGRIDRIKWVVASVSFILLCVGVLVFFVSRSIERPLLSMVAVAEAIGSGDGSTRVKIESENEFATLGRAINQMADGVAGANQRLEALATTDGLTGLLNRRCFGERLRDEWSRACRTGLPLSLLMIDVDHFKAFNDTHGHPAGDAALVAVAATLRASATRTGDFCARYGGEEFVALLSASDASAARIVAERVRTKLAGLDIPHASSTTRPTLTISIGTATAVPAIRSDPNLLVAAADTALYEAKRAGRDRVRASAGVIGLP